MKMTCENQITTQNLIDAKADAITIGEIATSKAGAASGGADISTAISRFGQSTQTMKGRSDSLNASADAFDALALQRVNEIGVIYDSPLRPWSAFLLVDDLRAHTEGGETYIPKATLPFTTGATFDINNWSLLQGITNGDLINDLSQTYTFATVAAFKASLIEFHDGKRIYLKDRCAYFSKITGTGTANTFNIIASTSVNQSIEINHRGTISLGQLGLTEGVEIELFMVAALAVSGVSIIEINEGSYVYTTKPNPAIESPQRIEVRDKVGLLIKGIGNVQVQTTGLTAAYINSVTDPTSSARDFVTFLSLIACTNCTVDNINIIGTNDKLQKIDFFTRPREKGVGILGGIGNKVTNCSFDSIWGNGVCITNTNILYDAPFEFAVNVEICNNSASNCAENGINPLGGTQNIRIHHNESFLNQANGIESGSDGGSIISNKVFDNFASGIGLSTKNHVTAYNEILRNGDNTSVAITTAGGVVVTGSNGTNKILNNVIKDNEGPALWVYPLQNGVTFSDNDCEFNSKNSSNISEYVSCNNVLGQECNNLTIKNNTFVGRSPTQTYGMQLNFINKLVVSGNDFDTSFGRVLTAAGDVNGTFANNTLLGDQIGAGSISNTSEPNGFLFQNNVGLEKLVGFRNSIPTVGAHNLADKYYKNFPALGGTMGWVCTIAGSPGTWKEFGAISS